MDKRFFLLMMNKFGIRTAKAIIIPFIKYVTGGSVTNIKNPTIIRMQRAEKLPSQVRFFIIIDMRPITPATAPNNNPVIICFLIA
jgi:hypothetical protein